MELIPERMCSLRERELLPKRIVLVFGSSSLKDSSILQAICQASEDSAYSLVLINDEGEEVELPDIPVKEYSPDPSDFLYDGRHLNPEGSRKLSLWLSEEIGR